MYIKITGPYALFARPEMRAERYSYDVITPSAAQGILKSIYWKPEMEYHIKAIHTYREPIRETIKTNDSCFKPNTKQLLSDRKMSTYVQDYRISRTAVILRDVEYVLEISVCLTDKEKESPENCVKKHMEIFQRRLKHGQYHHMPCLGAKEYPADVELLDSLPQNSLKGKIDLGLMLHHMDYSKKIPEPVFFHAIQENGIIRISKTCEKERSDYGWLFSDLIRQYKKMKNIYDLPEPGYSIEKICYEAVIDAQGTLKEFHPIKISDKENPVPIPITVPEPVKGRTSGIKPNFLWDVPGYAVGWAAKGVDSSDKFKAFGKLVKDVLTGDSAEETAMKNFVQRIPDQTLILPYAKDMELSRKIVFRLEGENTYIHENPVIRQKWENEYKKRMSGKRGTCIITGEQDVIAEMHPMITGVAGTKMNHGKLVSIDRNNGKAFECYGTGNCLSENTAIGETSCFQYAAMLNYYLSANKHKVILGTTTFVYWSDEDTPELIEKIRYFLTGIGDVPARGTASDERFYIAGLAPNAANGIRIGVRYYQAFQNSNCIERLRNFATQIQHLYDGRDIKLRQDWDFICSWERENMEDKNTIGYQLGMLFSVLNKIQVDAVPSTKRNHSSILYRYLKIAKRSPSRCMDRLVSNSFSHTKKIDYGLGRIRSELILKLAEYPDPYPKELSMGEQAMFQLGYEQMTKQLYTPKKRKEA